MSMTMSHRLQILLDDKRHQLVNSAAQARGVSVATVIREAIDRGVARGDGRRRAAGQRILAAPDMPVPELQELRAELDALRGRHG
ncbi:MAG: antitoxin [Candidatus Dormibacteraceae bacterium]